MRRVFYEQKIMGINTILIFAIFTIVFSLVSYFSGELLNLSVIGFEVIFPFLVTIAVGEWGKIRSDSNFNIIAAQSKSLFKWVVLRFATIFFIGSVFSLISMMIVFYIRHEMVFGEMILLYFPSAFFLSTICVLCGICFSQEHIATLICGIIWVLSMLARSLLRFPGVQFIYLFIRYAGDMNDIWLINKTILVLSGFALWSIIYVLCKKYTFIE